MAFAVSAKMLKAVQVFITTFFGLCGAGSRAAEQSQHLWKSLRVCLLHMRICSTDVSWLPGSRLSSPGLFGSDCDMVTHSSIWSSDWVTQGKLNDTEQYITCFSRPATTVKQMIIRKYWRRICCLYLVEKMRLTLWFPGLILVVTGCCRYIANARATRKSLSPQQDSYSD